MTNPLELDAVPESVLEALEAVRSPGTTNMLYRQAVIRFIPEYADDDAADEAIGWLIRNDDRYMEALNAMGARRAR